jgi:foldase protein PrsA
VTVGVGIVALIGLSACGEGLPNNAVVKVGDRAIAKATFAHWMAVAATSRAAKPSIDSRPTVVPKPPTYTACISSLEAKQSSKPGLGLSTAKLRNQCEQQYESLKGEALSFLISADWTLGEAKSRGITASPQEVQREFQQIKTQQFPTAAAFEHYLVGSGLTINDLLLRVKVNLLASKIQHKVIDATTKVTKSQVRSYYNEHTSRLADPEHRDLRILLTKTEADANRAKREVRSGIAFGTVAKRYPLGEVNGANVSELKGVTEDEGEAALDRPVFAADVGVLSGPVRTPSGYYVFEVTHIERPQRETLGQARASIEQQLAANQEQPALRRFLTQYRQNWIAKTQCRAGYVVSDCREYKP